MARWIGGLDGCRGRWAAALLDLDDPSRHATRLVGSPADILDGPEAPLAVGIDVPVGLPDRIVGRRAADAAARRELAGRGASVFAVPPRGAVYAESYEEAKRLSRASSDPPFAPSIQLWNIVPYIRQVDALLRSRPDLATRLHEVHPEIAFRRLNAGAALPAKKGAARAEGLARRRELLAAAGLPPALIADRAEGVGADDHLDALAALVVARAIVEGRAMPLPDPFEHDAHGLPVVIWAPPCR